MTVTITMKIIVAMTLRITVTIVSMTVTLSCTTEVRHYVGILTAFPSTGEESRHVCFGLVPI